MNNANDNLWNGAYKIPWDEPGFSRRMLSEHLSQQHDMASRRVEWIDRQVEWIHGTLLGGAAARVLDLGCGPGFYSHRLAALGHRCRGIDFGPASIEYAREHTRDGDRCEFTLGDIRSEAFGGPRDLAMILYGELNVFSPDEAAVILSKGRESLAPGGRLLVEVQTAEAVERVGHGEPSEQHVASGLFSDRPHRIRTENRWLADRKTTVQTFEVTEDDSDAPQQYRSTSRAWPNDAFTALLIGAGFAEAAPCPDWPVNTDDLTLWIAS